MQLLAAFLHAALVICLITAFHFPEQLGKPDFHRMHIYRKIKHLRLVFEYKVYTFAGTARQHFMGVHNKCQCIRLQTVDI